MAIIPQMNLFSWTEIEELGDLDRLRLVIEYLPDDKLMRTLEKERKNGRDDYPIRVVWNTILAGVVFEHKSIESLIRELNRNAQLRWLCGIENGKVPPSYVYSRFMKKLIDNEDEIEAIFLTLVEQISKCSPILESLLRSTEKLFHRLRIEKTKMKKKTAAGIQMPITA
ncbi:transposase [Virgibacillus sp. 179-BFC.A HS]|uniref:Transposase n=1 Tax=Tigheibacillus jepli TaxID=3035914 RepID=A0ABU5CD35_9BACI|nr:transposase [Virgibacillus sp. 179-BFC.A HS]MDY0404238.1 transposase [Virgibacillus sp. 179-BFC.A HS]